jgi:hypothetical protein
MQTDPTACHSLIGSLAALLPPSWRSTHRAARQASQVPFGNNEQSEIAGAGPPSATVPFLSAHPDPVA